ncbi:MAG TPA: response regulator, partial [Bacillota bacterium]|nr:response regulator [Bacillota bacterium]
MKNTYVLVVDDEYRIRRLVSDFLKREEYRVIEAADGEEALDIIFESNQKVDLVILDVMMPKYDGWYVLERIRDFLNTPVIMLTARSD